MSIKNTGARLWFETQAEIDDYDNLMISNIELKSEDYFDPNFTIVSNRSKKEIMPGNHNSLFNNSVAKMESFAIKQSHLRLGEHGLLGTRSLAIFKDYYLAKGWANWIVGYLVLRELPIRNFYARSVVMSWFILKYFKTYGIPSFNGNMISVQQSIKYNPFNKKEQSIFEWVNDRDFNLYTSDQGMVFD
jgi:hypothetical protein